MNKTKIDWATASWNPITGCLHGCQYCYARAIAHRFTPKDQDVFWHDCTQPGNGLHEIRKKHSSGGPWKYGFAPTLHSYRLREPSCTRKPQNVFVGSMADVFGNWVPDGWISEVFEACLKAPQHNYLFLSKNPHRYSILSAHCKLPRPENFWFGTTITTQRESNALVGSPIRHKRFLSIEPLLEPIWSSAILDYDWIIIGAESGNSKEKVVPRREWVADIVHQCQKWDIPIFMKSSLAAIWAEPLIQQYPDTLKQVAT